MPGRLRKSLSETDVHASVTGPKRISVCYAAPGHSLLHTSGSTRNILSLAEALSECADVTVAFKSILEPSVTDKYRVVAIKPENVNGRHFEDDVATRGLNPFSHLCYLRTIRAFARRHASSYDVVLEKGWRLSGYLSRAFVLQGTPSVLVENDVRRWSEPLTEIRAFVRYAVHGTSQLV